MLQYLFKTDDVDFHPYMTRIDSDRNQLIVYKVYIGTFCACIYILCNNFFVVVNFQMSEVPCEVQVSAKVGEIKCRKAFASSTVRFDEQERFVSAAAVLANDPVHSRTISVGTLSVD